MHIMALKLQSRDLQAQRDFYEHRLGLACQIAGDTLRVQIGSSELIFEHRPDFEGRSHFAFDIPENQFEAGTHWLEQRITIASDTNGKTRFETGEWNADNVYFYDPQGNILELIARHELENASSEPFGPDRLLNISEIGMASPNVPELIAWFANTLEIGTYLSSSEDFAPIGDANGLAIAVSEHRIWFPDTGIPAQMLPIELTIRGDRSATHEIPNSPYIVRVQARNRP
jgi:catechol 2,3-dioxygenase-like lactoylglutathione lyase family enzyme